MTDQFVTMGWSGEVATGDEVEQKNACGSVCISKKKHDQLKRLNLTIQLCIPHPYALEFLAGGATLTDGEAIGYGFPDLNDPDSPNGVSVEIWAERTSSSGSPDPDYPYAWWVFPRTYWQIDAGTFENGPMLITLNGFGTENTNWYDGPANDHPEPDETYRVASFIPTDTIPTAACAPTTLIAS